MSPTTKEIASEIRKEINQIKGVKVSATSDYNHIQVRLMEAPFQVDAEGKTEFSVNQYSFMESETMTKEAKVLFQMIDEIIQKYHWDKSDIMTDYFHCAFYYSFAVGRWDKGCKITA